MSLPRTERSDRPGVVLLMTLVVLVVLAVLAYTVTSRVAAHRHRVQYLIDHAQARYGLDSAMKYAVIAVENLDLSLISRPNEPDFSNLFSMTDEEIARLVAGTKGTDTGPGRTSGALSGRPAAGQNSMIKGLLGLLAGGRGSQGPDANALDANDPNVPGLAEDEVVIRGPYGPPWPLVAEPMELEIGSTKIRIEVEDENAKYPLGWMLLEDPAVQRAANAGFETFCEWMGWTGADIDTLKAQVAQVAEIRSFKMPADQPVAAAAAAAAARGTAATGAGARTAPTAATAAARQAAARAVPRRTDIRSVSPADKQIADTASLAHSSLLDRELLSRPTLASDKRKESLSKYMGLWGSTQVNINTAPRHVLEAAFAFGGDAAPIADGIIRQRQIQPIKDVSELRKTMTRYADSIEKGSKYVTCASTVLTIRITATSGVARASAVVGVVKEGKTVKTVGLISD